MTKPLQIIIGITTLIIAISIFYHYVIFLPQKENIRLEQQKQEELLREQEKQVKQIEQEKQEEQARQIEQEGQEEQKKQEELKLLAEQIKAQAEAEIEKWKKIEEEVQASIDASNKIKSSVQDKISENRNWLNEAYLLKTNSYYYKLVPLIDASEAYIITLQNLINSINNLNSIRREVLLAIKQRDEITYNNLAIKENNAVDNLIYWLDKEEREGQYVNALKTEVIKSF